MNKTLLLSALFLGIQLPVNARAQLNWFSANTGAAAVYVSPNPGQSSTAMLLHVPYSINFSSIYFNLNTADSNTVNLYDIGIGECLDASGVSDCSQPNTAITIVCDLASPAGSTSQGINLTARRAQTHPCTQGTQSLQPGVYMLLAVGTVANTGARCVGQSKSPVLPFTVTPTVAINGSATNGSLTNPNDSTVFSTGDAGVNGQTSVCMISLH
jgi:hypothetical protein